jgi:hypothetical protein
MACGSARYRMSRVGEHLDDDLYHTLASAAKALAAWFSRKGKKRLDGDATIL